MDCKIRPISVNDADAVGSLWFELSIHHEPYAKYYEVKKNALGSVVLYVRDLLKRGCVIFVAELNNEIIGFVSGYIVFRNPQLAVDRVGKVDNILVKQNNRSQGVGTKLLLRLFDHFKENGVSFIEISCDLENQKAMKLYKRLGFIEQKVLLVKEF